MGRAGKRARGRREGERERGDNCDRDNRRVTKKDIIKGKYNREIIQER
jgi:hypothetical protein